MVEIKVLHGIIKQFLEGPHNDTTAAIMSFCHYM